MLSAGRPRWAAQLCRLAAEQAYNNGRDQITMPNIEASLKKYGQLRLSDLYKEHKHQCPKMEILIEVFSTERPRYTTSDLLAKIETDIVNKQEDPIKIDGVVSKDTVLDIAHFLYRIGFLAARDDKSGVLGFVRFEDRPHLLSSRENPDDGLGWEIHPAYRSVLRIKRAESKSGAREEVSGAAAN
jgi:hypothetical protein